MARHIYQQVVQDGNGNALVGATITVYLAGTTTKATIYTAFSGGSADADSVIASAADGTFKFYVDTDDYAPSQQFKLTIVKAGYTTTTWDYLATVPIQLGVANEWTAQQNFDEVALTSSGNAVAWNLDTGQCVRHALTENTTVSAPSNMNAGATYILRVIQAAGVYSLAWNAAFEWGSADAPAAPAANGDVAIFSFYSDGSTMYGAEFNRTEA